MGRVKSIDFVERVEAYVEWGKRYVLFHRCWYQTLHTITITTPIIDHPFSSTPDHHNRHYHRQYHRH